MNYAQLARKYYPDKWCEQYQFSKNDGENVFKNISNEYEILSARLFHFFALD